jgi:hypothetical protein
MGFGEGVEGDDARIWKVAAAARTDADAVEGVPTEVGGVCIPRIGVIGKVLGEEILNGVRGSCSFPSERDGVLG